MINIFDGWSCKACTRVNSFDDDVCVGCGHHRVYYNLRR